MKIIIRTDASIKIGSGHIMRCLNLASRLKKVGVDVTFISRNLPGNMNSFILKKGFVLVELSKPENKQISNFSHGKWLFVSQEQDAKETINNLQGGICDWLVVDHYGLDQKWETLLRPHVKNIMVIDDFLNRAHNCDILLNQNYFLKNNNTYKGIVAPETRLLLGPKFALLSKEYLMARRKRKIHKGIINRVLIYFGSCPAQDVIEKVLEAFTLIKLKPLKFDIVLGAYEESQGLINVDNSMRDKIKYYTTIPSLHELMLKADLSIGAGGTTTWERFCIGIPSIVISTDENQEISAKALAKDGYHLYLGPAEYLKTNKIVKALKFFVDSPNSLKKITKIGKSLVDGKGIQRAAEILIKRKNMDYKKPGVI